MSEAHSERVQKKTQFQRRCYLMEIVMRACRTNLYWVLQLMI